MFFSENIERLCSAMPRRWRLQESGFRRWKKDGTRGWEKRRDKTHIAQDKALKQTDSQQTGRHTKKDTLQRRGREPKRPGERETTDSQRDGKRLEGTLRIVKARGRLGDGRREDPAIDTCKNFFNMSAKLTEVAVPWGARVSIYSGMSSIGDRRNVNWSRALRLKFFET